MHRLRLSQAPPNYPLPRRSRTSSCSPRWQSLSLHTSCPRTANAREQFSPTATVSLFLRQDVSVSLRVWTPRDLCCGLYRQSWILGLVASSLGVWRVSCGTFERVARPFGCLTNPKPYTHMQVPQQSTPSTLKMVDENQNRQSLTYTEVWVEHRGSIDEPDSCRERSEELCIYYM
jgi:hypothetical protein